MFPKKAIQIKGIIRLGFSEMAVLIYNYSSDKQLFPVRFRLKRICPGLYRIVLLIHPSGDLPHHHQPRLLFSAGGSDKIDSCGVVAQINRKIVKMCCINVKQETTRRIGNQILMIGQLV